MLLAAAIFVVEVTLGAAVAIDRTAVAVSMLGTYAVIAVVEAVLTALIVRGLLALRPDLVRVAGPLRRRRAEEAVAAPARARWARDERAASGSSARGRARPTC